jgi:hypothetical protein
LVIHVIEIDTKPVGSGEADHRDRWRASSSNPDGAGRSSQHLVAGGNGIRRYRDRSGSAGKPREEFRQDIPKRFDRRERRQLIPQHGAPVREQLIAKLGQGFKPLPMRNSKKAVVYYLFFASPKAVAEKIITDIFRNYEATA